MCCLDIRKAVEASKNVIDQKSYFSETIVINITPPKYPLIDIEPISQRAFSEA